ncbi:protein misato homolog 1 [Octopus sinensis]|uniref:Protein misato homolog 1 n=1 Tax=Octopus sinensis TaxID=2607531 RepID=A0A6P7T6P9_9MOLL|nr:protein misato homolog 1 [Octopus sinensis]
MATTTREVITLQLGHYANYVGTHWWNIQESSFEYDPSKVSGPSEINHDVLYREGKNLNGQVTFTPRLILWDLKGSLHCLKKEGTLYDFRIKNRPTEWHGNVTVKKKPKIEKNEFLKDIEKQEECYHVPSEYEEMETESAENSKEMETLEEINKREETDGNEECNSGDKIYNLDDSTEVWSDFLNIHLHPKTINIINDYTHKSEEQPFDVFGSGYETMSGTDIWAEMEDRLHYFTEECDMLQGFQILVDAHNAFTGAASSVLEYLQDEFSSKSLLTFGLSPTNFANTDRSGHHVINAALCYYQLPMQSSLFVPLSLSTSGWPSTSPSSPVYRKFPHVNYKPHLDYHGSAILAASLDTCTLPYRLRDKQTHMKDISHSLNSMSRKVAALCSTIPFPLGEDSSLIESLMQMGDQVPWTSISPYVNTETKPWMTSTTLRGIPNSMTKSDNISAEFAPLLSQCNTRDDVLKLYLSETMPSSLNAGCSVSSPCHLASSFPHIFTPNITSQGFISTMLRPPLQAVSTVPAMSSLQSTKDSGEMVGMLYEEAKKVNLKRFHRFLAAGLEEDEFKECLNELANLSENYCE